MSEERAADSAGRLFRSTAQSLARLYDGYSREELGVIVRFLMQNAARLRAETAKLDSDRSTARQSLRSAG